MDDIRIRVPFQYSQSFLPTKRHRKPRQMSVDGNVWAPIARPDEADFPVAFLVTEYHSLYERVKDYNGFVGPGNHIPVEEEIRTYNGKLFKPVRVTHGAAISTIFEGLDWIKTKLQPYGLALADDRNEWTEKSIKVSDDRNTYTTQILEYSKGYVFYDEKAWEETPEPRYVVQTFGLGHNHGGTAAFIEYFYNSNIPAKNYFNALQRDEAIAYGKEIALKRGDTKFVKGMFDHLDIKVLMPEMVKVNQLGN